MIRWIREEAFDWHVKPAGEAAPCSICGLPWPWIRGQEHRMAVSPFNFQTGRFARPDLDAEPWFEKRRVWPDGTCDVWEYWHGCPPGQQWVQIAVNGVYLD